MSISSLIFDLAIVALFIFCLLYYRSKGLVGSLVDLFGSIGCLVGAWLLSQQWAPRIFDDMLRPRIEKEVLEAMTQQTGTTLNDLLGRLLAFLPQETLDSMTVAIEDGVGTAGTQMSQVVVNDVIAPVVTPFVAIALFLISFFLMRLVLGIVAKLLTMVVKAPVISTVNHGLGLVVGLLMACLYTFLVLCVLWITDAVLGTNGFGHVYFGQSIIYRLTYWMNVFV